MIASLSSFLLSILMGRKGSVQNKPENATADALIGHSQSSPHRTVTRGVRL